MGLAVGVVGAEGADVRVGEHLEALHATEVGGRFAAHSARVSQRLVVIPTDNASPEQRAKYEAYAAKRLPRTAAPQGPARMMFAPELVGTSEQIAEQLYAHAAFQEVDEVAFALPFTLAAGAAVPLCR